MNVQCFCKIQLMTQSARATLLILVLLWQSMLWLTPLGQAQIMESPNNALTHAQAAAHQHQNDPSLHPYEAGVDGPHHHHHEAPQTMGLVPTASGFDLDRYRSTRFESHAQPIASISLQGPLRPLQPHAA